MPVHKKIRRAVKKTTSGVRRKITGRVKKVKRGVRRFRRSFQKVNPIRAINRVTKALEKSRTRTRTRRRPRR